MGRVKIIVAYDGADYAGWQRQPNIKTVQGVLDDAIEKLVGVYVKTYSSGRTDEGVHALCQVVHFDNPSNIQPERFKRALNTMLPDDIRIMSSEGVSDDFNARYTAKTKTYRYNMYLSDVEIPTKRRYAVAIPTYVDIDKMKRALTAVVGVHDFYGLSRRGSSSTTTVRNVYRAELISEGENLILEISGNGFLYNMVRIIAGTIIEIGAGKRDENALEIAINSKDRTKAGRTARANGLILQKVEY